VVFSVDGAGNFQATSAALQEAIEMEHLPLKVEVFEWSHGYARVLSDQVDRAHARRQGEALARRIGSLRQQYPGAQIDVVAHSAGCAVALAAAESLPVDTVDTIVLLAPSVSADYDLRPTLCSARRSVDVFYSRRDLGYLGVGVALFGTADHCWRCPAAGRVGFRPHPQTDADLALFTKLRQHPWDPCLEWTGNVGGHYDGYRLNHLRAYVLPLFAAGCRPTS
jgi:pimeloyl-ACP methyl ester carboxylesterase